MPVVWEPAGGTGHEVPSCWIQCTYGHLTFWYSVDIKWCPYPQTYLKHPIRRPSAVSLQRQNLQVSAIACKGNHEWQDNMPFLFTAYRVQILQLYFYRSTEFLVTDGWKAPLKCWNMVGVFKFRSSANALCRTTPTNTCEKHTWTHSPVGVEGMWSP